MILLIQLLVQLGRLEKKINFYCLHEESFSFPFSVKVTAISFSVRFTSVRFIVRFSVRGAVTFV